jgi:hypothetical protein
LVGLHYASGSKFRLVGFQCNSGSLDSPANLIDADGALSSICENLIVKIKELKTEEEDDGKFVRVILSHSSLPGDNNEIELFKKPLPIKEKEFNSQLQSLKLGQGPAAAKWKNQRGHFFLIVSIWDKLDSKGKTFEFDTLSLR